MTKTMWVSRVSAEKLRATELMFFYILVTCLLTNAMILEGEFRCGSLLRTETLNKRYSRHRFFFSCVLLPVLIMRPSLPSSLAFDGPVYRYGGKDYISNNRETGARRQQTFSYLPQFPSRMEWRTLKMLNIHG